MQTKDLSQEYGLFDPKNKDSKDEKIFIDHQQRYDESIQESAIAPESAQLEEVPSEDRNFTRNFYKYSNDYQDNEGGPPGVDDDFGIYSSREDLKLDVDVNEVAEDDSLLAPDNKTGA